MVKAIFAKGHGRTLVPADHYAEEFLDGCKLGAGFSIEIKKVRNLKFHRKFFSLLNLGFDTWEPDGARMHRGEPISKSFERFREDILILAGHYDQSFGIDGSVRLTAKSISFGKCDEVEFNRIYKSVLDVLWDRIFRQSNYRSQEEVDRIVGQMLGYLG